jgi:hypothetical protein
MDQPTPNTGKQIPFSSVSAGAQITPSSILISDARNRAFAKEYERFKQNQNRFKALMVTPDAYPLMFELFEAIKQHFYTLTDQEISDSNFVVKYSFFGRTWTTKFLFSGFMGRTETYLSIGHPEPVHVAMAVISFNIPDHWEF